MCKVSDYTYPIAEMCVKKLKNGCQIPLLDQQLAFRGQGIDKEKYTYVMAHCISYHTKKVYLEEVYKFLNKVIVPVHSLPLQFGT